MSPFKKTLSVLLVSIVVLGSSSAHAETRTLELTIDNVKKIQGSLRIAIYDSKKNYDVDMSPVARAVQTVNSETMIFLIQLPTHGSYAAKVAHDENNNEKLDTNLVGIPTESYGFTGNKGKFGPPSFDDASIVLDTDTKATIHLR